MGNPMMPAADYVRVEISAGGVTYTYELEPEPGLPITAEITIDVEEHERTTDTLTVERLPDRQRAGIRVAGKLKSAARQSA